MKGDSARDAARGLDPTREVIPRTGGEAVRHLRLGLDLKLELTLQRRWAQAWELRHRIERGGWRRVNEDRYCDGWGGGGTEGVGVVRPAPLTGARTVGIQRRRRVAAAAAPAPGVCSPRCGKEPPHAGAARYRSRSRSYM